MAKTGKKARLAGVSEDRFEQMLAQGDHLPLPQDSEHASARKSTKRMSKRLYEIELFVKECSTGLPTIVLGDFNEGLGGVAVRYLEDRGYRNALPLYRPGQHTWQGSSVANQFTQTLDHVLFDGSFEPLNAWVSNVGGSDHLPVVVHLEEAYDWQPDDPAEP